MLSKILSIAGAVCSLVAVLGLVNRLFGTTFGVNAGSSGSSTGAIPTDPVIIGFFLIVGAVCLLAAFLLGRRQIVK